MAEHELIEAYLARLRRRLPADLVDELADGLVESWNADAATESGRAAPAR